MAKLSQEQIRDIRKSLEVQYSNITEKHKKAMADELRPIESSMMALYLNCSHPNNQMITKGAFPHIKCPDCGNWEYV